MNRERKVMVGGLRREVWRSEVFREDDKPGEPGRGLNGMGMGIGMGYGHGYGYG
jgi:hypothetical protein